MAPHCETSAAAMYPVRLMLRVRCGVAEEFVSAMAFSEAEHGFVEVYEQRSMVTAQHAISSIARLHAGRQIRLGLHDRIRVTL